MVPGWRQELDNRQAGSRVAIGKILKVGMPKNLPEATAPGHLIMGCLSEVVASWNILCWHVSCGNFLSVAIRL